MEFNPTMQSELILRKCLMVEQPAQVDQYYRPYETTFNTDIQSQLYGISERLAGNFTSSSLRDSAVGLIQPASVAQGNLSIVNGWRERRVCVFIDVEIRTRSGNYREVITGFSDHVGITPTGAIDHRMVVYPNNYIKYRSTKIQNATGVHMHASVDANDQILRPITAENVGYGLRPKDSMAYLSYGSWGQQHDIHDSRVMINRAGVMSDRKNQLPSDYLTRTLIGFNTSLDETDGFGGPEARYANASSGIDEHTPMLVNLFSLLDSECNYFQNGYFDMGSLLKHFPDNGDSTYHYVPLGQGTITDYNGLSESWGQTSKQAKIAYSLTNIVPSIISSFLTVSYSFTVTNMTPDGQVFLGPQGPPNPMFEGLDDQNRMMAMDSRLASEIASLMRVNNVGAFDVRMTCNLFGNNVINISIDGEPSYPFAAPNYCDHITSPLQAVDLSQGKGFAGDINSAIETVFHDTLKSQTHQY